MLGLLQDSVIKKTVTTSEPMFSAVMGGKNGVVEPGQDPVLPTVPLGHHGGSKATNKLHSFGGSSRKPTIGLSEENAYQPVVWASGVPGRSRD